MNSEVTTEKEAGVLVVTINRPHVRNAIDGATSTALAKAFDELEADPDLRAGVLTGAGGWFSAGMDLKAFAAGQSVADASRGFGGITSVTPQKPVVAAVEGFALGGGFEIALACDIIVAAEDAYFGLPEVTRGVTAGAGGLLRLPRQIPYHLALELILTGEPFPAMRAYEVGLVNRLARRGKALGVALEVAKRVASNAPLAVLASRRVVVESPDWPLGSSLANQMVILAPVSESADAMEGARAFAERRTPVWKGR